MFSSYFFLDTFGKVILLGQLDSRKRNFSWLRKIFPFVVALLILIIGVTYLSSQKDELKVISTFSPHTLVPIFLFSLLIITSRGLQFNFLVESFGVKLVFWELFGLSVVTSMGNYLTPLRGGAGLRAIYLKTQYNLSYSLFISTLGGLYIIVSLLNSIIGISTMGILFLREKIFNWTLFGMFLGVMLIMTIIMLLKPTFRQCRNTILEKINVALGGWYEIRKNRQLIWKILLLSLCNSLSWMIIMFYAFKAFQINLTLDKALFLAVLNQFSLLLTITPGSFGITEAIIVFSANALGILPAQSLVVALLIRLINLILVFTLGPIFSFLLTKKNRSQSL